MKHSIQIPFCGFYESHASCIIDDDDARADDFDAIESDFLKALLESYSITLQRECEYLTSDEAVTEMIEANDYEFTEEGDLY